MSKHIGDLKVGETVECKGPIEKLPYKANMKKRLGLIAGAPHAPSPNSTHPQRWPSPRTCVHACPSHAAHQSRAVSPNL